MDDLRKQLDLDNKYSTTKKKLKKIGNNLYKKDWSLLKRCVIIAIPIIAFFVINYALGGLFEKEKNEDISLTLPEPAIVSIKLDDNLDPDTDGLLTKEELELGTNPFNRDTDGDGVTDDGEINLGLDPLKEDKDILVEAYKGINGSKHDVPVSYDNFSLRADSLKSRAYMTAISDVLPSGVKEYTFNLTGTIDGEGFAKRKDGFFEKTNKTQSKGETIIRVGESETVTTLKVFGNNTVIENPFLRGLLNFFLPKHGAIAAFDNLKTDYTPNALVMNNIFSATNMDFAKETNLSDNRFNLLHLDTSYKDRLVERLKAGEIVPVSILSNDKEYLIYITGQYDNGDFLAVDAKTNKEIGILELKKKAIPMTDGQSLVQMETLRFKLGELGSEKGDRLIFL